MQISPFSVNLFSPFKLFPSVIYQPFPGTAIEDKGSTFQTYYLVMVAAETILELYLEHVYSDRIGNLVEKEFNSGQCNSLQAINILSYFIYDIYDVCMIAITNGVLWLIYTMVLKYINARSMTCNGIMTLCKHRLTQV